MDQPMDEHNLALISLCRICGQRCTKWAWPNQNRGLKKANHAQRIRETFNVNVDNDVAGIHPQHLCLSCTAVLGKNTRRPVIGWTEHNNGDCRACQLMKATIGKRRHKPAKVAAQRRKEREEEERQKAVLDKACDVILEASRKYKQPTKKMKRVATAVIKNILTDDQVELPTGGPKFVLQKVVQPKVSSTNASERTVRARNSRIQKHINSISSPDGDDSAAVHQLAALLKGKTKAELKVLLQSKGLLNIKIPAGQELKMKAQMGWTWCEMRKLKRWLKAYKITMVCEGASRKRKRDLVGGYVEGDMVPFMFKEEEEHVPKLAPMVYIPDLTGHVMKTLDELERLNLLVHDGVPDDQIWIKIGGDKGGGTTKFYYQIVNVSKNNSKYNTTAFCVYEADESVANLHTALDQYVPQISALQNTQWRGKTIVLWLVGDYEIERKLLGLQGASATFPCTYCHQTKDDLASVPDASLRDLRTLQDDFDNVEASNFTSEAKRSHHSVSHRPFFDIPLEQVCPPALHLSLGLWSKFYNNLEHDLQQFGQRIAEDVEPSCSTSASFKEYVERTKEVLEEVQQLEEKADQLHEEAVDMEYQAITQSLIDGPSPSYTQMEEIESLHRQSEELNKEAQGKRKANKLEPEHNPLIQRLDETLQSFKVRRQAYFSKAFVGNHVDKCLKAENYTLLLAEIVSATKDLTPNEDLHDMASNIQMKYMLLFEKFQKCYKGYSCCETFNTDQADKLESHINDLVGYYKSSFPQYSFTPKFHILYKHVIPFIRATGVGLGRMSEQGGEQLHHLFNVLGRQLQGVKNVKGEAPELRHLRAIMEEHLISVHPSLRPTTLMEE